MPTQRSLSGISGQGTLFRGTGMREFNEELIMKKFKKIRRECIDALVPDMTVGRGNSKFIKDIYELDNPFSKMITPHICREKSLFKKERNSIPKNGNKLEYIELFYDDEGRLIRGELEAGRAGFLSETLLGADSSKFVTFYVSDDLWIDVTANSVAGDYKYSWTNFEKSERDSDGRLVSVESFKNDLSITEGVIINAEYYEFEDGVLSHITQYKDYYSHLPAMMRDFVIGAMPDRVFNPDVINYSFERSGGDIICTRSQYYRVSQTWGHKESGMTE